MEILSTFPVPAADPVTPVLEYLCQIGNPFRIVLPSGKSLIAIPLKENEKPEEAIRRTVQVKDIFPGASDGE